jgi:hypothetical protein
MMWLLAGIVIILVTFITKHSYIDFKQYYFNRPPKRFQNFQRQEAAYGSKFGSKFSSISSDGHVFIFPDFKLIHVYYRSLNPEEKKRKMESNKKGIAGGDSMISPFHGFEVIRHDGQPIKNFELSILPYKHERFNANGKSYEIQNLDDGWIIKAVEQKNAN